MGFLIVTGKVDVGQFWPSGSSDADTAKVIVQTDNDAFEFQPDASQPFTTTHVFQSAKVIGKATKSAIDNQGRITVRLQGIDAPELHYRPNPIRKSAEVTEDQREHFKELNEDYRQHLGETAAVKLHNLLAQAGNGSIPCMVSTAVDNPSEVFDTYGRFVGDLMVQIQSKELNINRWLLQEGWAFPTFYSSMSSEEIQALTADSQAGRKQKQSIWSHLQDRIGKFDEKLIYRGKNVELESDKDIGPLILPKLFRRLCTWSIYRKVGIETRTFQRYVADSRDGCFLTEEFLEQGPTASTPYSLSEFLKGRGQVDFQPEHLVFTEKPSKLVDALGKPITAW